TGMGIDEINDGWIAYSADAFVGEKDRHCKKPLSSRRTLVATSGTFRDHALATVSPDGLRIALLDRGTLHPVLRIIVTETGTIDRTIRIKGSLRGMLHDVIDMEENNLSWSNKNSIIIAVSDSRGTSLADVHVPTGQITDQVRLPFSMIQHPSVSRDGRSMVFSAVAASAADIYIYDRVNGSLLRLTDDSFFDSHPSFTPDSASVVFSSNRNNDGDFGRERSGLFIIDLRSGKTSPLLNSRGSDIQAVVSPDGRHMLYVSEMSGRSALYRYNFRTGISDIITGIGGEISHPSWFPDGKRFACISCGDHECKFVMADFTDDGAEERP
ncbi:MAG: hypothetical protein E4G96_06355, partial [Chrysiogenales bacterium]